MAFSIISDLDFFGEAMSDYGGEAGRLLKFDPDEPTARSMIDEIVPIDMRKMENINELHTEMCTVAQDCFIYTVYVVFNLTERFQYE